MSESILTTDANKRRKNLKNFAESHRDRYYWENYKS